MIGITLLWCLHITEVFAH